MFFFKVNPMLLAHPQKGKTHFSR